jgi:hypothetical protein
MISTRSISAFAATTVFLLGGVPATPAQAASINTKSIDCQLITAENQRDGVASESYCANAVGVITGQTTQLDGRVYTMKIDPRDGSARLWRDGKKVDGVSTVHDLLIAYAIETNSYTVVDTQSPTPVPGAPTPMAANACTYVLGATGVYFTAIGIAATIFVPYAAIPAAIAFGGLSVLATFLGFSC